MFLSQINKKYNYLIAFIIKCFILLAFGQQHLPPLASSFETEASRNNPLSDSQSISSNYGIEEDLKHECVRKCTPNTPKMKCRYHFHVTYDLRNKS